MTPDGNSEIDIAASRPGLQHAMPLGFICGSIQLLVFDHGFGLCVMREQLDGLQMSVVLDQSPKTRPDRSRGMGHGDVCKKRKEIVGIAKVAGANRGQNAFPIFVRP